MINMVFIVIGIILFGALLGVVLWFISEKNKDHKEFILLDDFCSNTIPSKFPN